MTRRLIDVIVVGAGQSGLAMGRELAIRGLSHLILDGAKSIGSVWENRWDSLRLFTPASYSSLPDIPFPAPPDHLPTRLEVVQYLQNYARALSLQVALDEPVRSVHTAADGTYHVHSDYACYRARNVVIATGGYQSPKLPPFASMVARQIVQLHSSSYRNPSQIGTGPVVVVGGGNSGVQIAQELSHTHDVALASGTPLIRLPARAFGRSIFSWLDRTGAMNVPVHSTLGRRFSRRETLIGESPKRIARAHGVKLLTRVVRVEGNALRTATGSAVRPETIIWATGFKPSYDWLQFPVFHPDGRPEHTRGATRMPGLYFIGLPWQHTRGSSLLGWVGRDAEWTAQHISDRLAGRSRTPRREHAA